MKKQRREEKTSRLNGRVEENVVKAVDGRDDRCAVVVEMGDGWWWWSLISSGGGLSGWWFDGRSK